jgi:hypothetical protein
VTAPLCNAPRPRWTREQIRAARLAPLVPLLQKRGLQLAEREAGNFVLPAYPASSSRTAIGAGLNAIWVVTPSTSSCAHSACDRAGGYLQLADIVPGVSVLRGADGVNGSWTN